jgi:hypothetical protein
VWSMMIRQSTTRGESGCLKALWKYHRFSRVDEFRTWLNTAPGSCDSTFLIDQDLGSQSESGLQLMRAEKLRGYLVTGQYEDMNIQEECICLGIQIIPKPYIYLVPIDQSPLTSRFNSDHHECFWRHQSCDQGSQMAGLWVGCDLPLTKK